MSDPAPTREDKVLNGLLLAALFISGVVLVREGPHFDNVLDGWPFFTSAFFGGTLLGYLVWTFSSGVRPTLKFTGSYRHPWLAALTLGLVAASTSSYINRTFAAPPDRTVTAGIESVEEGKGTRWHVTVKMPDGRFQRYLIPKEAAEALKKAKSVRMSIARGALGFDFVAKFEPEG